VKWFKDEKGFGFVELANGQGDAFLHATALHAAGHDSVAPGEWHEEFRCGGGGEPGPCIGDVGAYHAALERGRNGQYAFGRPAHRLDGVAAEIDDRLLDLDPICEHQVLCGVQPPSLPASRIRTPAGSDRVGSARACRVRHGP
jgi:cold shock CspA family protein